MNNTEFQLKFVFSKDIMILPRHFKISSILIINPKITVLAFPHFLGWEDLLSCLLALVLFILFLRDECLIYNLIIILSRWLRKFVN